MTWIRFREEKLELFDIRGSETSHTTSISGMIGGKIKTIVKTVAMYSFYLLLVISLFTGGMVISDDEEDLGINSVLENVENLSRTVGDTFSEIASKDADGDGISDAVEMDREDLSVDRKDIQVVVVYGEGIPHLSTSEKRDLTTIWNNMTVSNPDNSSGVNFEIVEEINASEQLYIPSNASSNERGDILDGWYGDYINQSQCGSHHMIVLGEVRLDDYDGWGDAPGYSSIVDGQETRRYNMGYSGRTRLITHELLHNIVGDVEQGHIEDDSKHTPNGWLSKTTTPNDEYLSSQVSDQLSTIGFRESAYHRAVVC